MTDEFSEYSQYLHKGQRIEIGIPLSDGGIFRDWAIVTDYREDTVQVQLSRDYLPSGVRVDVDFILDVSVWVKKDVYTCIGIVTDKKSDRVLRIRVFGKFTLRERRQFFRLEATIRLRYAPSHELSTEEIKADWQQRRELENLKYQGYDPFVAAVHQEHLKPAHELAWSKLFSTKVSIGGGGIRFKLAGKHWPDSLFNLELHLPLSPPRIIHTVAEVIHQMEPLVEQEGAEPIFSTGMRFVYMDERDRDLMFTYISVMQIAYLRERVENRPDNEPTAGVTAPLRWRVILSRAAWASFFILLALYFVRAVIRYKKSGGSSEIRQIYQDSIKKYRGEQ